MITIKQESVLLKKLKSLTELELVCVFEELADHIQKNRLTEAVQVALDLDDLRSEIDSLERDVEDAQEEASDWESKCQHAQNALSDIENLDDDLQKELDRIINMLE